MTNHTELLEQSFEINLNNFGPKDVERLNDWSIKAHDALQSAQAEIERHKLHIKHIGNDALRTENAELRARLATTEGANSMLMGRNKWLEHVLEVQPVQGLQSVADALTIEQLNDKVERLMAVQPSQAGGVSKQDIYDIAHRKATRYVCTAAPSDVMYGFSEMHLLDFVAAINAKESK